jgi:hypothetical protein
MYENDPNRMNRPRVGDPVDAGGSSFLFAGIAIAAIIALAIFLWPRGETGPSVTQTTPGVDRPAPTTPTTPPANKPVTPAPTPAPTPPQ